MSSRHTRGRLVAVALLLSGSTALYAQSPDFEDIDDPLNGRYELYGVDDLVVSRMMATSNEGQSVLLSYFLTTESSAIAGVSAETLGRIECTETGGRMPLVARPGHFFNLLKDVTITVAPDIAAGADDCEDATAAQMFLRSGDEQVSFDIPSFGMTRAYVVVADVDLDGLDEALLMNDSVIMAGTARSAAKWDLGMIYGTQTALPESAGPKLEPVAGDFNADGLVEAAWIGVDNTVHFATICPGDVADTICDGKDALDIVLDPLESQAQPITGARDGAALCALAAGRFDGVPGDGLVSIDCWSYGYIASWYEFNPDLSLAGGSAMAELDFWGVFPINRAEVLAVTARLDWFDNREQVVVSSTGIQHCENSSLNTQRFESTGVITFGENALTLHDVTGGISECELKIFLPGWLNGLAVGGFTSIADEPDTEAEFNRQIAVLLNDNTLRIYSVNAPEDFTPTLVSETQVAAFGPLPAKNTFVSQNWLAAGDLQGRSARLGAPSVIRIPNHSQPSVILGAPPMHVDYVQPHATTGSGWQIVNFSAVPDTFNSSYEMAETGSNQSADTSRLSYTLTTKQTIGTSFRLKPPYIPSVKGSLKWTTANKHEDMSEDYVFEENEFQYNASTATGLGDEIWYADSAMNLYIYPVLGETVCPADDSDCTPENEEQLFLMFSGPESSTTGPAPGPTTEWYQPVHEPGNIFSYPWNETTLIQRMDTGIDLLSTSQSFFTDASTQAQSLEWSGSGGADVTVGTTNNHSYEKSYSLSGGKQLGELVDADLSGDFLYNLSSSVSTLNKSSSSLGSSEGVVIEKPGTFRTPGLYQYRVLPFIFGRAPPANQLDELTLSEDIQTEGPLQVAFAVDPRDSVAGSWWASDASPYTQYIDVALNHPVRWTKTDPTGTQESLDCLPAEGIRNNCMVFNDPYPADLWNSEFYWMRGLLVTVGGVDGPQRSQAEEGEYLVLQTRVYNYSLKDMDADSTIKVRLYRQEIDGTTPVGSSVLISERTLDPLPGFNSTLHPDEPNWTTVSSILGTDGLGGKYFIFWVAVWAEDASGQLVEELPGHGLESLPSGTYTGIGAIPIERVSVDGVTRSFSNNVGFLHRKFYIAPAGTQAQASVQAAVLAPAATSMEAASMTADAPAAAAPASFESADLKSARPTSYVPTAATTPAAAAEPVLGIRRVQVKSGARSGGGVILSFEVTSRQAAAEHVHVQVYADGEHWRRYRDDRARRAQARLPRGSANRQAFRTRDLVTPPRPFDVESLPFIPEGGSDRVEVPWRAVLCRPTEFVIVAYSDVDGEGTVTKSVMVPPTRSHANGRYGRPSQCGRR